MEPCRWRGVFVVSYRFSRRSGFAMLLFVAAARRQAIQSAVPSHGMSHGVRANPILALVASQSETEAPRDRPPV